MSQVIAPFPPPQTEQRAVSNEPLPTHRARRWIFTFIAVVALAALTYFAWRHYGIWHAQQQDAGIPVSKVQRSDISFIITAKGELRGSNPETLIAPPSGGGELHITYLKKNGEPVNAGAVIVAFDTSEQEYKLKEAQADEAEAEQKILQAKAQRDAQKEEDQYALIKANTDILLAELDVRKNPLLPSITASQNVLALDAARERLKQVQQNLANRATTGDAGITKEEAGRIKAESQVKTAKENIEAMTIRAKHAGYVSIKQNTNTNFGYDGMILPILQVGDSVRSGVAIAEIPDLNNWQIAASVSEADRGHIKTGDAAIVHLVALPGRSFRGHVLDLGGTVGNFWERHFECKVALDQKSDAMRPGMSTELVIDTETMHNALAVPTQALFDAGGVTYVYVKEGKTFARKDVKLVRKNESRAVISGLNEGQLVALANPLEKPKTKEESSALKAAPK